jgi:hypothetical protein
VPPLELPRVLAGDPATAGLPSRLAAAARPLWRDGVLRVAELPLEAGLAELLASAHGRNRLVLGLEAIAGQLDREATGLAIADRRAGSARGARVSRLLLVTTDGSERFYREVERIAGRHAARLLVIRLTVDAPTLATTVLGRAAEVKAVLVSRKDDVALALRALAGPEAG